MTLGTLLKSSRLAAGLTLPQLADALGLSLAFLEAVEQDRRPLGPAHWPLFARVLPDLHNNTLAHERSLERRGADIDAAVFAALHEVPDTEPIEQVAEVAGVSMLTLRASMRRLIARPPDPDA